MILKDIALKISNIGGRICLYIERNSPYFPPIGSFNQDSPMARTEILFTAETSEAFITTSKDGHRDAIFEGPTELRVIDEPLEINHVFEIGRREDGEEDSNIILGAFFKILGPILPEFEPWTLVGADVVAINFFNIIIDADFFHGHGNWGNKG